MSQYGKYVPPTTPSLETVQTQQENPLQQISNNENPDSIPASSIEKVRDLDRGYFGMVSLYKLNRSGADSMLVAGKSILPTDSSKAQNLLEDLKSEYNTLSKIGPHANIIKSIGFVYDANPPCFLMEFVDGTSLLKLLRTTSVSDMDKIRYSYQLTCGVEYLQSKGILHRDLAARNCIVRKLGGTLDDLKIVDFGHARDVSLALIYVERSASTFSYQWAAPECFNHIWSFGSDIWSVGVTLWEIFTNGAEPYAVYFNTTMTPDIIREFITAGRRLETTDEFGTFSPPLAALLSQCWNSEPNFRPSITHIVGFFNDKFKAATLGSESDLRSISCVVDDEEAEDD